MGCSCSSGSTCLNFLLISSLLKNDASLFKLTLYDLPCPLTFLLCSANQSGPYTVHTPLRFHFQPQGNNPPMYHFIQIFFKYINDHFPIPNENFCKNFQVGSKKKGFSFFFFFVLQWGPKKSDIRLEVLNGTEGLRVKCLKIGTWVVEVGKNHAWHCREFEGKLHKRD